MRPLAVLWLCFGAVCSHAEEPFDVSLAYSSADLSAHYRSMIRNATELYRGDGPAHLVTATMERVAGSEFETEEIRDFMRGTIDLYLRHVSPAGGRRTVSEAHFESDPFSSYSTPLCITMGVAARASNHAMERTADRCTPHF